MEHIGKAAALGVGTRTRQGTRFKKSGMTRELGRKTMLVRNVVIPKWNLGRLNTPNFPVTGAKRSNKPKGNNHQIPVNSDLGPQREIASTLLVVVLFF
jgi:hypothetical protein